MNIDRRSVLKALALAGLAVAGVPIGQAGLKNDAMAVGGSAIQGLRVTSVVSGTALDASFLMGVREGVSEQAGATALPPWQLNGLEASGFTRLATLSRDETPTLLVGLVDDASAALVLDLVRSAGGRVMHSQHHRLGTSDAAAQWAQAIGRTLVAAEAAPLVLSTTADPSGRAYVSFSCVI